VSREANSDLGNDGVEIAGENGTAKDAFAMCLDYFSGDFDKTPNPALTVSAPFHQLSETLANWTNAQNRKETELHD